MNGRKYFLQDLKYVPFQHLSGNTGKYHENRSGYTTYLPGPSLAKGSKVLPAEPSCSMARHFIHLKNHSNMFRIVCDPSSWNIELYLTEINRSGLNQFPARRTVHTHTTGSNHYE